MAVVEIVLRQVAEVVDLQLVAEVHRDPLLAPAAVHLVVGPDRGAPVVRVLPRLPDLAAEHAGADVPALGRPPVVVDRSAEHTSELQSLMRTSYAALRLQKKKLYGH